MRLYCYETKEGKTICKLFATGTAPEEITIENGQKAQRCRRAELACSIISWSGAL